MNPCTEQKSDNNFANLLSTQEWEEDQFKSLQKISLIKHFQAQVLPVTFFALGSRPSIHAYFGAAGVAVKVTKEVVSGSAELVAKGAKVVGVAAEAEAVFQAQGATVVTVGLPLLSGV